MGENVSTVNKSGAQELETGNIYKFTIQNVLKGILHEILGVQLCFRRFPIDSFSDKWWSK